MAEDMAENTERTGAPARPAPLTRAASPAGPAPRTARQRRPTGAPPPLPHPFTISTTAWLVLAVLIVTCGFLFSAHTSPLLAATVDGAVAFVSRARLVSYVRDQEGLALCGRGAPCPG